MSRYCFLVLVLVCACTSGEQKPIEIEEVSLGVEQISDYPKLLSEWNFFRESLKDLIPSDASIFPYDINAPLFSDYAYKARLIRLPRDSAMNYHASEVFEFPVGTVLIKNFYYPNDFRNEVGGRNILETRLLIREDEEWKAIVYAWNEEQTDAERLLVGKKQGISWIDEKGVVQQTAYEIPSQPKCKSCHDLNGAITPIGPSARQLNRKDQLTSWIEKGLVQGAATDLPELTDYRDDSRPVGMRARAWLEVNCAHCHRREGPAKNSGLYLLASQADPYRLGVNKPPIAAGKGSGGLKYGIVPGNPDQSILVHRIESLEPGEMMPELGRTIIHQEGVELIRRWIEEM